MPHAVTPIAVESKIANTAHRKSDPLVVMCASAFGGFTVKALFAATFPTSRDAAKTAVTAFMI